MRTVTALFVISISSSSGNAQPSASPPQGYPPPPHQYVPAAHYPAMVTAEEHELLMQGEISDGQHFGGVVANIFVGYGVGQAIQGRWSDTGWIFTLGEGVSTVAFIYGLANVFESCGANDCDEDGATGALLVGVIGTVVFRTWSIIDAAGGPGDHNRRLRSLKYRLGIPVQVGLQPYVNRTTDGASAGLTLRF